MWLHALRLGESDANGDIEERSFDCVARRANIARKKKACDSAQDDNVNRKAAA